MIRETREYAEGVTARFLEDAARLVEELRHDAAAIEQALANRNLHRIQTLVGKHRPGAAARIVLAQELLTMLEAFRESGR